MRLEQAIRGERQRKVPVSNAKIAKETTSEEDKLELQTNLEVTGHIGNTS
jgi:hypothetical protein